jgi:hypothetical protein
VNEEIQALLDKARRYIRSAELLRADGDYNSAISRLYYAMFYCAEAILFSKGLALPNAPHWLAMRADASARRPYHARFSAFEFDSEQRELRRDGVVLPLRTSNSKGILSLPLL